MPIYVAGSGPRILELAGRVADGVIALVGVDERYVRAAVERVRAGASSAGRDPSAVRIVLWCPCAVGNTGTAADAVKAHVARIIIRPMPVGLAEDERRVAARVKAHYDYYGHMEAASVHAQSVNDELALRFAFVGDIATIVHRAEAIAALGVDEIAIVPYPTAQAGLEDILRGLSEGVARSE